METAIACNFRWRNVPEEVPHAERIILASQLPDDITAIPDDVLNWAIECEATGRPFRLVKPELEFYRTMRIPVHRLHPDERHRRRMATRNPRMLWERRCVKCGKNIQTTYAPDREESVYCDECYLKEMYVRV